MRRRKRVLARGNAGLGYLMFMERGGSEAQFRCLDVLWGDRESAWRTWVDGGIPQAKPASKMAAAGRDWRTSARTQILWGLGYITGRYGTACAALAHSYRNNWY